MAFKRRYSHNLLVAIDWAMELDPLLRPQTVDEFLQVIVADNAGPTKEDKDFIGKLANAFFLGGRR